MNLSELRYIVSLAKERHFGRAAEACYVSQPTLSVAVKKLEAELGVVLFERGAHHVRVTPAGENIVEQVQQALEKVALAWRASFPRPKVIDALRDAVASTQLSCIRPLIHRQKPLS